MSNSQQKEKRSEINGQHAIVRNLIRKFGIGHESAALVAARHPEDADEWLTLNHLRTARSIEDEFTAGLFYQIERLNISAAILAGKPQGYKITKAEVAIITEQIIKNEHLAPYKHTAYLTARYVALKVIAEEDGGEPLSLRRTEKELAKYSSVLHTFDDIHNVAIVYNPSNEVSVHNKEGNVIDSYRFGGDGFLVRRVGPDLVLTLIFDVAGHDIWVSALKAAILRKFKEEARVAVHSTSHRKREDSGKILEETANSMNRYICRLCDLMDEHSRFVTAEATVIDYRLRELHHLSAGQQSRSLVTSDGQLITHEGKIIDSNGVVGVSAESAVGAGNPLMGIMPNLRYDSTRLKMGPSITAYYSTDGTIEKASIDIDGRVAKLTEDMLSGIVYNGVKDASAARYPGERATVADSIMQIFERIKGPDDKTFIAVELPGEFDAMLDVVGRRIIEKVRQKSRQNIRYFAIVIDSESRSRHLLASQLTEAGYEVAPIETESRLESAREALGIVDGDFVLIFNRNISGGLLSLSGMEPLLIDNQLLKNVDRYLKETVEAYLQSV